MVILKLFIVVIERKNGSYDDTIHGSKHSLDSHYDFLESTFQIAYYYFLI